MKKVTLPILPGQVTVFALRQSWKARAGGLDELAVADWEEVT